MRISGAHLNLFDLVRFSVGKITLDATGPDFQNSGRSNRDPVSQDPIVDLSSDGRVWFHKDMARENHHFRSSQTGKHINLPSKMMTYNAEGVEVPTDRKKGIQVDLFA